MGHPCHPQRPAGTPERGPRRAGHGAGLPGAPLLLLFVLIASSISACKGAPMPSQALESDEDLQLLKEIDDACSAYLSTDSQPQVSNTLEELCFLIMGFLQKPQFLFHYSKTHDSGNSDIMEELQGPGVIQSRGYFFYRPRNGRRSVGFR
ncbi:neuromedin-U isoform X4 [Zonotrichia albicollis]|uniref:neuromedin-U isoform X4 n=1 Tax=Zonotrichia albicollis TaxID=44394 RepID=UPI0006B732C1|nr:neuromedin-U isoform X4 [Zonotrichia albicollis]